MIVSSHQPSLFPWVGYWNKVLLSDAHILSAGVQFDYGGYQNRVQVLDSWLTLPVPKAERGKPLCQVQFDTTVLSRVFKTLREGLGGRKWPYRDRIHHVVDLLEEAGWDDHRYLSGFNLAAARIVSVMLGWHGRFLYDVWEDTAPTKTERLVDRVRRSVRSDNIEYLAGGGAVSYLEPALLPPGFSVSVQVPKEGICSNSVLQLIAREADPAAVIRASCDWRRLDPAPHRGDSPS